MCSNLTTLADLNQLPTTLTEHLTYATALNILLSNEEKISLLKVTKFQAPEDCRNTTTILKAYADYPEISSVCYSLSIEHGMDT